MKKTDEDHINNGPPELLPSELAHAMAQELKASSALYKLTRPKRRLEKKRIEDAKVKFNSVATNYLEEIFYDDTDPGGEKGVKIFDKWDNRWRAFARKQISKYPYIYKETEQRQELTNYFLQFVGNYREKIETKPEAPTKAKAKGLSPETIEKIHETLKELGIKTSARTPAGLLKVVNSKVEVVSPQYKVLKELLTSEL